MCQWCDEENFKIQQRNSEDNHNSWYNALGNGRNTNFEIHSTVTHVSDLEFTGKLPNGTMIKGKLDGTLIIDNLITVETFGSPGTIWNTTSRVDEILATLRGRFIRDDDGACYYLSQEKETNSGTMD